MKKIFLSCIISLFICNFCFSQEVENPLNKDTSVNAEKKVISTAYQRITRLRKKVKPVKEDCHCIGTNFDTCCVKKPICCETKLIKDEIPGTSILQKNFGDATPFSFKHFRLNGKKENLCIRICNINRLVFDITTKGEIVKAALPDSSFFDGLAKVYKETPILAAETEPENNGTEPQGIDKSPDSTVTPLTLSPYKTLENKTNNIKSAITQLSINLSFQLKKLEQFSRFAVDVPNIIGSECCSQQRIKKRLGEQADLKAVFENLTYENLSTSINVDIPLIFEETKQLAKQITHQKNELKKLIADYKAKFCQPRRDTIRRNNMTTIRIRNLSPSCNSIDELAILNNAEDIDKALSIVNKSNKDDLIKTISSINNILAKVDNENNFFYTQCFDKTDAEFINVLFKAIPKSIYKDKFDSVSYPAYTVPVIGRFKWAIGPSLNFHFGGNLMNNSFSLDSAKNSSGNIMKDTFSISKNAQRGKVVPYIGFMAHFYWQQHRVFTPGITIGISTSPTQLSDLRTYLGLSAIIGGPIKGKLIFSAGLSGASIDRLKPNLVEGLNAKNRLLFNGNNLPGAEQLIEKVFKLGFFFGMTYNLKD